MATPSLREIPPLTPLMLRDVEEKVHHDHSLGADPGAGPREDSAGARVPVVTVQAAREIFISEGKRNINLRLGV